MNKASHTVRRIIGVSLAAALTGCGGGVLQSPLGFSAVSQQMTEERVPLGQDGNLLGTATRVSLNVPRYHHSSWISGNAKKSKLLYVTGSSRGNVYIFSFPQMVYQTDISGLSVPAGACADKQGHVWIAQQGSSMLNEYAHGGTTPIATLSDPGIPVGCSVDPTTGNLAVTNYTGGGSGVAIYQNAQGTPTIYSDTALSTYYFCGYDDSGNLFVDGRTSNHVFQLATLPAGQSTFTNLTLSGGTINVPGGVQWNDGYLAVGDQRYHGVHKSAIYEVAISGSSAQIVHKAILKGTKDVVQFWIQGNSVVTPDTLAVDVSRYKYPRGGKAVVTYRPSPDTFDPYGSAVSVPQ